MPDTALLVKKYLDQDAALLTLVAPAGSRAEGAEFQDLADHILIGDLPQGADPNSYNPFVMIAPDGGSSHPEAPIVADRIRIRVWAGINDHRTARQVYEEIANWLGRQNGIDLAPDGFILISQEVSRPQQLTDPDSGWATVLAYYQITARNSTEPARSRPSVYQGSGPPSTLHNEGDIYVDLASGNVYEQINGEWTSSLGTITVGGDPEMPSLTYHKVSAASTNAAVIKNSAGTVTGWKIYNNSGAAIYVKLYDKATTPVPGTDTPKQTIGVDAGMGEVLNGAGFSYSLGIGIAIVQGIADNDSSAVAAADCVVDVFYQ